MSDKIESNLNLPNAAQQSAETLEHLEERERVLTLLHDFYQERQKNMPVHKEIAELVEKLRGLFEKVYPLIDEFYGSESKVGQRYNLKTGRKEIVREWKQGEKNGWLDILMIIEQLETVLRGEVFDKEPTKENRIKIEELKKSFENIDVQLNQKVGELWEIRKNIVKELIKIVPEFTKFNDAKLVPSFLNNGLYNLNSSIIAKKTFETKKGDEEKDIHFDLDSFIIESSFQNLMKQYNLTDKELKEIKSLEWSAEEKENLKNLMEDVDEYKAETEKMKQGLLKSKNLKFKTAGADLVKDEFVRAFVRQSYEDYNLPVVHKERVVQEIMNGTFTPTL